MSCATDQETVPLLPSQKSHRTPLPWGQFSIVLIMQLAEPVTSSVIYPFLPDLIRGLPTREENVGHYVGLLEGLFFVTQTFTVMYWSKFSDIIGRKPVIMSGLTGLALSMYCFGLSKTFWELVLSRCLNGALNGNIGVMKSIFAEITDETNAAQAISWLPLVWNTGSMLGPILGGLLSRPTEQFPSLFGGSEFFKKYPYFLACAVPATFALIVVSITALYFQETLKSPGSILCLMKRKALGTTSQCREAANIPSSQIEGQSLLDYDAEEKCASFTELLKNPRVKVAGRAYALINLVDTAYVTIQPTFLSTPPEYGGLGWSPSLIGQFLAIRAILNGFIQIMFFAKLVQRYGARKVYLFSAAVFLPIFALYKPINSLAVNGMWGWSWTFLILQAVISLGISAGFGSVMMYINSSTPNRRSLGATNGITQLGASIMRAIGPALANSLFSITLKGGYLGGSLVYVVLVAVSSFAMWAGTYLPPNVWIVESEE